MLLKCMHTAPPEMASLTTHQSRPTRHGDRKLFPRNILCHRFRVMERQCRAGIGVLRRINGTRHVTSAADLRSGTDHVGKIRLARTSERFAYLIQTRKEMTDVTP